MIRIGQGIDVHPFDESRPLILGGVRISETGGLQGHSDADAVLHALADAMFGAMAAGDIGEHFPSDEIKWKGANSASFVIRALELVREENGTINNVDVTVIAQKPRLAPHRAAMRTSIARILGLPLDRVSVKATTTDHLGFTGREEGICAMAIVAIELP